MTGEKFVRSLPYFRKRSFRKAFDECDDDDTLDFLEKLLILEPSDRSDAKQALQHPYFKKYPKNDTDNLPKKFHEVYDDASLSITGANNENWIELIRQNVEIQDS